MDFSKLSQNPELKATGEYSCLKQISDYMKYRLRFTYTLILVLN